MRSGGVAAPVRKRAELAGRLKHARAEIVRLQAILAAIDTALEAFDPAIRAELIPPGKRYRPAPDGPYLKVGGRVVLDLLRRTGEPLTAREIAARLLAEAGYQSDEKLLRRARGTIGKTLARHRAKGAVACRYVPGRQVLWESARD